MWVALKKKTSEIELATEVTLRSDVNVNRVRRAPGMSAGYEQKPARRKGEKRAQDVKFMYPE